MVDLNKKLQMCMLVDFYGNLLTDKQKNIFSSYWEKDYSLYEVAEQFGITRQAVHDCLNKAEAILLNIEQKCGFVKKYQENKTELQQVINSLNLADSNQATLASQLTEIIKKL